MMFDRRAFSGYGLAMTIAMVQSVNALAGNGKNERNDESCYPPGGGHEKALYQNH
jgi:hypothetical protein